MLPSANISSDIEQLIEEAVHLGYNRLSSSQDLRWVVSRIFLHTGKWQIDQITEAACDELVAAIRTFGDRPDIAFFHGSAEEYRRRARKSYLTAVHRLKVVLYHRGQAATEPWKVMPKYAEPSPGHPRMLAPSLGWLILYVVIYGTAYGAFSPLRASVMADHFGRRAYGSITAVQGIPVAVCAGLGPLAAGWLYDVLHHYELAFWLCAGAFLLAALGLVMTASPRQDHEGTSHTRMRLKEDATEGQEVN
jgi:hypothetical protein